MKDKQSGWWKFLFASAAVLLLCLFVYLVIEERSGRTLTLIASAFCLIGARLDDIVELKLSATGLEAKLQKTLIEAKETLEQATTLAKLQGRIALEVINGSGRYGGGIDKKKVKADIVATLTSLGVPAAEIQELETAAEYKFHHFDYARSYVTKPFDPAVLQGEKLTAWNDFWAKKHGKGFGNEPSPAELRTFLDNQGFLTPGMEERLKDYQHYETTKTHRRPAEWDAFLER